MKWTNEGSRGQQIEYTHTNKRMFDLSLRQVVSSFNGLYEFGLLAKLMVLFPKIVGIRGSDADGHLRPGNRIATVDGLVP